MNYFAEEIITNVILDNNNNYLLVKLYDSFMYVYRKEKFIVVKNTDNEVFYNNSNFNFTCSKPIETVTIIWDRYGTPYTEIFNKRFCKAATIIQQAWRNKTK